MGFTVNTQNIILELIVSYKDNVTTTPPVDKYKVKNLFVDPETGKLEVEYDDTPVK